MAIRPELEMAPTGSAQSQVSFMSIRQRTYKLTGILVVMLESHPRWRGKIADSFVLKTKKMPPKSRLNELQDAFTQTSASKPSSPPRFYLRLCRWKDWLIDVTHTRTQTVCDIQPLKLHLAVQAPLGRLIGTCATSHQKRETEVLCEEARSAMCLHCTYYTALHL